MLQSGVYGNFSLAVLDNGLRLNRRGTCQAVTLWLLFLLLSQMSLDRWPQAVRQPVCLAVSGRAGAASLIMLFLHTRRWVWLDRWCSDWFVLTLFSWQFIGFEVLVIDNQWQDPECFQGSGDSMTLLHPLWSAPRQGLNCYSQAWFLHHPRLAGFALAQRNVWDATVGAYASVVEAQDISVLNAPVKCLFLCRLHPLLDPGLADNFPNFPQFPVGHAWAHQLQIQLHSFLSLFIYFLRWIAI